VSAALRKLRRQFLLFVAAAKAVPKRISLPVPVRRKGPDGPVLNIKEERMSPLSVVFAGAAGDVIAGGLFWLIVLAILLSDDARKRDQRSQDRRSRGPAP